MFGTVLQYGQAKLKEKMNDIKYQALSELFGTGSYDSTVPDSSFYQKMRTHYVDPSTVKDLREGALATTYGSVHDQNGADIYLNRALAGTPLGRAIGIHEKYEALSKRDPNSPNQLAEHLHVDRMAQYEMMKTDPEAYEAYQAHLQRGASTGHEFYNHALNLAQMNN
ncbi:MAG: hypothetical protein JW716_02020 [Candidatus Aenigmarchaeota archaeon]|nr:hypothetical protein [Candidatus Aenigmarchaeota archaeon]